MNLSILARVIPAMVIAGAPAWTQATAFDGPPGGVGDVLVFPSPGAVPQRPAELQGITLLTIDAAGRSGFTSFLMEEPRLKEDVPGASRILLPSNKGSLYRFRRATPAGADYGYFVVRPDGMADFLAAFPGTGPQGDRDPIPGHVAINRSGDAMLVATRPAAGGDLYEVDLLTGATRNVTDGIGPQDFLDQGLALTNTWGAGLTTEGPVRFRRTVGTPPLGTRPHHNLTLVGLGMPIVTFGDGIAVSADGSRMAIVGHVGPGEAHVFTFGDDGITTRVTTGPLDILDPAFGDAAGPNLAISPDGGRVAWKADVGLASEAFTRRVPTTPTPPAVQITADANFTDTLSDTGVISFFGPDKLVMLVGEANGVAGIEGGDFYQADLSGGGLVLSNLTQTSGDTVAPFLEKGELETTDGLFLLPDGQGIVSFVPASSDQGTIQRVDLVNGTIEVLGGDLESLLFAEVAGNNLIMGVLHEAPGGREILRIPFDGSRAVTTLGDFPRSATFGPMAGAPTGFLGGTVGVGTGEVLGQVFVPSGAGAVTTSPRQYGPVCGFDGASAMLTSMDTTTQTLFLGWSITRQTVVYGSAPQGFVLPAN